MVVDGEARRQIDLLRFLLMCTIGGLLFEIVLVGILLAVVFA